MSTHHTADMPGSFTRYVMSGGSTAQPLLVYTGALNPFAAGAANWGWFCESRS